MYVINYNKKDKKWEEILQLFGSVVKIIITGRVRLKVRVRVR
jgi:hypothetical protein